MNTQEMLTKQEIAVLKLVLKGSRNTEIASELFISTKTVESHLSRIFEKLGVATRTQAAIYAVKNKLLADPKNVG